jgi:hypothetical protein
MLNFDGDIGRLRKRLKTASGVEVRDGFPEYGKDFRRFHLKSEHQRLCPRR